jgi:hypothetical protein
MNWYDVFLENEKEVLAPARRKNIGISQKVTPKQKKVKSWLVWLLRTSKVLPQNSGSKIRLA